MVAGDGECSVSRYTGKANKEVARNKVLTEHIQQGRELQVIAGEVGYSRRQLSRIKREVMAEIVTNTELTQAELKAKHRQRCQELIAEVERHRKGDEPLSLKCIAELRALLELEWKYDEAIKSIGVNVNADIDPAKLVGYRRFVLETSGLDGDGLEKVYEFARSLTRPEPVSYLPPKNAPLWLEGETCGS